LLIFETAIENRITNPSRDPVAPPVRSNCRRSTLPVVDHYIEFFERVEANFVPGGVIPPIATTDGLRFDRQPLPEERAALLACLRKL
jgi:hypothetical protein